MHRLIDFIDDVIKQVEVVEVGGRKLVLKKYSSEPGLVKWFVVKSLSLPLQIYPYTMNSRERMSREIEFFSTKPGGVCTPEIVDVDWDQLTMLREYVDGEHLIPSISVDKVSCIAETLYKIHSSNYCLGDSKYSNFLLVNSGRVYIIDAEQSVKCSLDYMKAWDTVVFLTTIVYALGPVKAILETEEITSFMKSFIEKYIDYGGVDYVREIGDNMKLKTLVQVLLPPPYSIKLIQLVKELVRK